MKKKLLTTMLLGIAALSANTVFAANVTGNFQTTSTLNSACTISAVDIAFGNINPMTYIGTATGNISVLCSKGVAYSIAPNSVDSAWGPRMTGTNGNTDQLTYALLKGASQSDGQWYKDVPNGKINGTGSGVLQVLTIGAHIEPSYENNRTAKPDTYSATVVATITY